MYKEKLTCRCCGGTNLAPYLDLGNQPLANDYHKKDRNLPYFPLKVNFCSDCSHSQLSIVVNPDLMFKNYLYVSGTTETLKRHFEKLVSTVKPGSVLDIAANDTLLLEIFRKNGCEVEGVDPAVNLREISKSKNINVYVDYWSSALAKKINKQYDIITAVNVFAHVDDLEDFLLGCQIALKDDGVVLIEFPYCKNLIKNNEFDTIYHEHLSYFTIKSFSTLVKRMNFNIKDIVFSEIHGGSIRFVLKKEPYNFSFTEELQDHTQLAKKVLKIKEDFNNLTKTLNKKVVAYGASAKGSTALNYFGQFFDYVVDDNPMKVGYYTPGNDMIIRHSSYLKEEKSDLYIVITAWNFKEEIMRRVREFRQNDKFILYIPEVCLL